MVVTPPLMLLKSKLMRLTGNRSWTPARQLEVLHKPGGDSLGTLVVEDGVGAEDAVVDVKVAGDKAGRGDKIDRFISIS